MGTTARSGRPSLRITQASTDQPRVWGTKSIMKTLRRVRRSPPLSIQVLPWWRLASTTNIAMVDARPPIPRMNSTYGRMSRVWMRWSSSGSPMAS